MNIIMITGASSGMGLEFALQLDNVFDSIDEKKRRNAEGC